MDATSMDVEDRQVREAKRYAYLLQLNFSPPPIIRFRLQARGEQAPDGGRVHGGQRGWSLGRRRGGEAQLMVVRGKRADGGASSGRVRIRSVARGTRQARAEDGSERRRRGGRRDEITGVEERQGEEEMRARRRGRSGGVGVRGKPERGSAARIRWVRLLVVVAQDFFPRFRVSPPVVALRLVAPGLGACVLFFLFLFFLLSFFQLAAAGLR